MKVGEKISYFWVFVMIIVSCITVFIISKFGDINLVYPVCISECIVFGIISIISLGFIRCPSCNKIQFNIGNEGPAALPQTIKIDYKCKYCKYEWFELD